MAANNELAYTTHSYGDHVLQRVGVWRFKHEDTSRSNDGYWLVFIHGGAWRDPKIDHGAFVPSINSVCANDASKASVRGFASIDYRLSPHPNYPQDPAITPANELRNARHPDHISDVRAALHFLSANLDIVSDRNYVLIGHSAGATLAYQLLMGNDVLGQQDLRPVPAPAIILGISGIYDLLGIDERHGGQYAGMIAGAFGENRDEWLRVSPKAYHGRFAQTYSYLAWSPDDSLIDEPEIDAMLEKLNREDDRVVGDKGLSGEHDFVWEDGTQIPPLIIKALEGYNKSSLSKTNIS